MEHSLSRNWEEFCTALAESGKILRGPHVPIGSIDQAEGLRYLSRLTRISLEAFVESSDPDFPRLFNMTDDTIKIGGDNPDNIYWNANIAGDREYRIRGHRGAVPYLSFGTKANRLATDGQMVSTGEIEDGDICFAEDGRFEILVSQTPQSGNWLPMSADTSMLLVRQTFFDKAAESPAVLQIECVNGPQHPKPLNPATIDSKLRGAAAFVRGTSEIFADWTRMFMGEPNQLLLRDQATFQNVGGDPNIHYLHGYWRLEPGEAWVIETEVPNCRFWNFVLQNWWMESGEYRYNPNSWLNPAKAVLGAEKRLTIVVAEKDPGFGNWIDTAGHSEGTALLRWISAERHPVPQCRVVRVSDWMG